MGIVFITIPGDDKQVFGNALHWKTNGAVDLVIIQRTENHSLTKRLIRLREAVGWKNIPRELYYATLLRLNRKVREALQYFREADLPFALKFHIPRTLEVSSVNSDEVHTVLRKISPDLLVVWGSTILAPRILTTAKKAINLHLGHCPHYRGALANQHAVLRDDLQRLGATIHYINGKADAGDILAVVTADATKAPRDFFRELNNKAREKYLEVATSLFNGKKLFAKKQDAHSNKVLLLKNWTPTLRYKVGRQVLAWERRTNSSKS